jgi:peroxiredoxin
VDSFAIGVQLVLAGVFALAGAAKLQDLAGSRQAMVDFGVPEGLASILGTLLPIAELATAVALVLNPTAEAGAVAALTLLLLFTAGISNAMIRGRAPDCNCFGQVHSAPVGPWTLVRNLVLAALAAFLVAHGPGPAIDDWVAARSAAELVAIGATIAALALAAFAFREWSSKRRLEGHVHSADGAPVELAQLEAQLMSEGKTPFGEAAGLPVGSKAPDFELTDMWGNTHTLRSLLARGRPLVLEFVDPTCGSCNKLYPAVARWQSALTERVTVALVTRGSRDDRASWEEHGVSDVLLDESNEVFDAFRVWSTPNAIAIELDGTIASAAAGGSHMPEVLVHQVIKRLTADHDLAPRAPAQPQSEAAVVQLDPDAS